MSQEEIGTDPEQGSAKITRRTALMGASLATLAACGGGGKKSSSSPGGGDIAVVTPAPTPPASSAPPTASVKPAPTPTPTPAPAPAPTPAPTPAPAPAPSPTPTPAPSAPLTSQQASRFLAQATNGATGADIARLAKGGIDAWIAEQFAMPRSQSHWSWMESRGFHKDAELARAGRAKSNWDASIWHQLITVPDQLRQRVALTLLDFMVVGIDHLDLQWPQFAMGAYMDLLLDHAFGDFRKLLGAITTNPAMGSFLTFLGSRKANNKGALPDENYARELMQLFTIGLYELNQDGSLKRDGHGQPIETYTQEDVKQLARVFTGFRLASYDFATPEALRTPMVIKDNINETGPSTFLGWQVQGGGMQAVDAALDVIFNHANVPPFISRALIQGLVTSNPSPDYVRRVADVFSDNGKGQRGDLGAVVYAILQDPEARSDLAILAPHAGKLRAPVQRLTNWARACGVTSASGTWGGIGDRSSSAKGFAQSPGRSPSVFNFFRPGYVPPNSELAMRGLVAPEFQMVNEQSIIGYSNQLYILINKGTNDGDIAPDYAPLVAKADDPAALVAEVNLLLAAGQLTTASLPLIQSAVEQIDLKRANGAEDRVKAALFLTMSAPDYLILK